MSLIEQLREARAKATKSIRVGNNGVWKEQLIGSDDDGDFILASVNCGMPNWQADLEYLSLAANHIETLIKAHEVMREALKRLAYSIPNGLARHTLAEVDQLLEIK